MKLRSTVKWLTPAQARKMLVFRKEAEVGSDTWRDFLVGLYDRAEAAESIGAGCTGCAVIS